MIEKITVKNFKSFGGQGQDISGLEKINFFYGANGSGKTTVSRIIDDQDSCTDCSISWESNNKLKTFVYNRDFITQNFSPDKELPGIFTLGKDATGVVKSIATAKKGYDDITIKIEGKKNTLQGKDENGGKNKELKDLEDDFTKDCWAYKNEYEDVFKDAFKGNLIKEKFKKTYS